MLLHTWTEISVEFFFDNKPILQKINDLLKLNLIIIISVLGILPKKLTLVSFFKRIYKTRAVAVFLTRETLVLKHLLYLEIIFKLDLLSGSEFYLIHPNLLWNNPDPPLYALTSLAFDQISPRTGFLIAIQP